MIPIEDMQDHFRIACERTQAALFEAGAAALIATSPANVQYLTGYRSSNHARNIINQTYALLSPEGKRVLIIPSSDIDFASMGGFDADEIRTFDTFFIESADSGAILTDSERHLATFSASMNSKHTWIEGISACLKAEGLSKATLSVDQGHVMPSFWGILQEMLPEAQLLDAYQLMLHVRAVKSPFEIQMLHQSSKYTETAIQESLKVATDGATDCDIRNSFVKSLIDSGAEPLFSSIGVGTRSCFPNVQPNNTILKIGDLLRYDAGGRFQGYASDLARTATLGPAPDKVRNYFQAVVDGEEAAIRKMAPGVLACEIFNVAVETIRKNGIPHYRRNHCGHAIGLDMYEAPLIKPDDRTPLEAGMTFCIETPYYELGFGGIQIEDLVLVTENGAEILSTQSRELYEIAT